MTTLGAVIVKVALDATGVESGAASAKKSILGIGEAAKQASVDSSDGIGKMSSNMEKIGGAGDKASDKVDAATKNIIGSIQRTIAQLEAGSRSGSKFFETIATQRGVDPASIKPYLEQLDAINAKNAAANSALSKTGSAFNEFGRSAKETALALRQVPAQFTDVIVSLQSGQTPLTVLLQQGGQLKDLFGGIGPAFRAISSYVIGLVNPLTVAAGAVVSLGSAYAIGSKEADAYAKSIVLTGNAAGVTVGQLQLMARSVSGIVGTQGAAADALAQLAATGAVAGKNLEQFTVIAVRMQRLTGQSVDDTVKQFAELGKSPADAAIKLNEKTNFLTVSIYQQIKALEEQGRVVEAVSLAQQSYADAVSPRLDQLQSRLGTFEKAWLNVKDAAKFAWDSMLDVGRQDTLETKMAAAEKRLADVRQIKSGGQLFLPKIGDVESFNIDKTIGNYESLISRLKDSQVLGATVAARQKESAETQKAGVEASKYFDKMHDGQKTVENLNKKLKEYNDNLAAIKKSGGEVPSLSQQNIDRAEIRKRFSDASIVKPTRDLDIERIRKDSEELIKIYTTSESIMQAVHAAGLIDDNQYFESKRAFINLESQAKEDAFQKELRILQNQRLIGKDKIENDKKIIDVQAKLSENRINAAAKLQVLSIQEQAAADRIKAALLSARQAAQDYFDTFKRQQDRALGGLGKGVDSRNFESGISQIEDKYLSERRGLENNKALLELEGKFTSDAKTQYEERLSLINEFQSKSIASYTEYYGKLKVLEKDASLGAMEALRNYSDNAKNVYAQTDRLVSRSMQNIEDALVRFVTTGKLSFTDLANSIVSDITRIIVKQMISNSLGVAGSGGVGDVISKLAGKILWTSTGGYDSNYLANLSGMRATGGPVSSGNMYRVNENGPEILQVAGRQYLMMGNQSGDVKPVENTSKAGQTIIVNVTPPAGTSRSSASQWGAEAARQLSRATARNS